MGKSSIDHFHTYEIKADIDKKPFILIRFLSCISDMDKLSRITDVHHDRSFRTDIHAKYSQAPLIFIFLRRC